MKILFFNASAAANVYEAPGKKEGQQKKAICCAKINIFVKKNDLNKFYYYKYLR